MKNKITALALMLYAITTYGQSPPTPTLIYSKPIDATTGNDQTEPSIAINKNHPTNLLVSSNVRYNPGGGYSQTYYVSINGGVSWAYGGDHMPNSYGSSGEPSTAFDASGNAYLTGIDDGGAPFDRYNLEVSTDKGLTWGAQLGGPLTYSPYFDRPMSTADDMPTSPYANNYYCVWHDINANTISFNRSPDQGATFDDETNLLNSSLGEIDANGADVKTGPNGEVYVCWSDYQSAHPGFIFPAAGIGFAYSTDGGGTFNRLGPQIATTGISSTDWAHPDAHFNNTSINDWPSIAVDKSCSSGHRGRIYIVTPGTMVVYYCDPDLVHGTFSWNNTTNIQASFSQYSFLPRIAVDDETGMVSVVYYSMDPTTFETDTWIAYSADGGATWSNIKISNHSHVLTQLDPSGYAGLRIGISAFGGSTYATWMDNTTYGPGSTTLDGKWHIWIAKVDFDAAAMTSSTADLHINTASISNQHNFEATDKVYIADINSVTITSTGVSDIKAGQAIIITPTTGKYFATDLGAVATLHIAPSSCSTPGAMTKTNATPTTHNSLIRTNNLTDKIEFYVYPNPTSDYITLMAQNNNYQNVSISISDIEGRVIAEYNNANVSAKQIKQVIQTQTLAQGIYIATLHADDQKISVKFAKE